MWGVLIRPIMPNVNPEGVTPILRPKSEKERRELRGIRASDEAESAKEVLEAEPLIVKESGWPSSLNLKVPETAQKKLAADL